METELEFLERIKEKCYCGWEFRPEVKKRLELLKESQNTVFTENNNQQESNGGRSLTSNNTSSPADTSYFNEETN